MEINSKKAGIARSLEENRALSKTLQAKDAPSSSSAAKSDLKEGQQLKGTILDLRYHEVKLRLEPGKQIVIARLSGEVPLAIGEEAKFQVIEDGANRLVLKFLPEDVTPMDAAILKALTASGLPATDRNKAILSELLKHRMPIDKHTLQTLIKAAITNRDASPQSLVLMLKNNIPLTASNIRQFEAYQNGSGRLITDIQDLTKSLSQLLAQAGEPESGAAVPSNSNAATTGSSFAQTTVLNQPIVQTADQDSSFSRPMTQLADQSPAFTQPIEQSTDHAPSLAAMEPASNLLSDQVSIQSNKIADQFQQVLSLNASLVRLLLDHPEHSGEIRTLKAEDAANITTGKEYTGSYDGLTGLPEVLTETEQASLAQLIGQLPEGSSFAERLTTGSTSVTDVLKFISEQLPIAEMEIAKAMLQSSEYAKLLTETFHQRWTITPEILEQNGSVSKLYRRLQDDMEAFRLLGESEEKLPDSIKLQEPVKNLQDNLHFMKDLNQLFTYLQLPVQMENQDVHSELYVFTSKRALRAKKDISVLLHLDMPNLGALNIHVTLEHNIVNAKFYPEEKSAKAIITDNVPSLGEALRKKGYHLNYEVMDAYHKPDFVKDFIEQNAEENSSVRYSFDIRA